MSTITEKINEIIDRRLGRGEWQGKGRLQRIESAESRLAVLRNKIDSLKILLDQIEYQQQEKRGDYYAMLQRDPQMGDKIKAISTKETIRAMDTLQRELGLLKKRFSRESVQIAMIGRERQGKSRLIQSITGLGNEVIPAFDGSSCTGTVSVIHNSTTPFHADIAFFERGDFLEDINTKLVRLFHEESMMLSSIEQIPNLADRLKNKNLSSEAESFLENIVKHYNDYGHLIGSNPISLSDCNEVCQYVAQYQLFDNKEDCPSGFEIVQRDPDENGVVKYAALYYKYLAVKSVNIYTPFNYPDSGKLVLVDTIGIGQPFNNEKLLEEMYRVVREDSDGAIDVFRPDAMGTSLGDTQMEILQGINNRFGDIHPEKWLLYVINEVRATKGYNADKTPAMLADAEKKKKSNDISFAWAKIVNCGDPKEVIEKMVIPHLDLITGNLDEIDNGMMKKAEKAADELYNEYLLLCKSVNAVLSSSLKNNQNTVHLFDELYKSLGLSSAMRILDETKYEAQNKPCQEVFSRLSEITENTIYDALPVEDCIVKEVDAGVKAVPTIFMEAINEFRNRIFDVYENINVENLHPLQEEVRMEMIQLLFNEGLLGRIPLVGYNVSDGPSKEWLEALLNETVDKETYPHVYNALRLILDYQISIEGLVEYNVANSVHLINPMYPEFFQMPFVPLPTNDIKEQSAHIVQEIFNRITHIQQKMRLWINDFSLIPSHSFYARVHKVRERLFLSTEGNEQLRYYYLDNCGAIWREEIQKDAVVAEAFGTWNAMSNELNALLDKNNFNI